MVILKNLTKRTIVLMLTHEATCTETECHCVRQKVGTVKHNPKTGDQALQVHKKRLPSSVTLFPKGETEGAGESLVKLDQAGPLPMGAARSPEVKAAKLRGEIAIEVVERKAGAPSGGEPTPDPQPARHQKRRDERPEAEKV